MSTIGANVDVLNRPGKHDHRLRAEEHDHRLSAERIQTAAVTMSALVARYVDLPAVDVSPVERRRLSEAAALMERAAELLLDEV
jgi:ABC-type branched-subunit amino acid transport system ATPase component